MTTEILTLLERCTGLERMAATVYEVLARRFEGDGELTALWSSMARDEQISGVVARLSPGRQTPWVAAILTFAMAAVLVPIGSVKILAEMSSFSALVAFFAVNVVLIVLRYRLPVLERPFRVPLAVGQMPVLPVLAIASIVMLLIHFEWQIYAAGGIALAMTAVAFGVREWSRRMKS